MRFITPLTAAAADKPARGRGSRGGPGSRGGRGSRGGGTGRGRGRGGGTTAANTAANASIARKTPVVESKTTSRRPAAGVLAELPQQTFLHVKTSDFCIKSF